MGYNSTCSDFAELCKGSTTDSDSVCLGSNPSSAATVSRMFRSGHFFGSIVNLKVISGLQYNALPKYGGNEKCQKNLPE